MYIYPLLAMVLVDPMDQWDTSSPHMLVAMVFLALQLYTKSINQGGAQTINCIRPKSRVINRISLMEYNHPHIFEGPYVVNCILNTPRQTDASHLFRGKKAVIQDSHGSSPSQQDQIDRNCTLGSVGGPQNYLRLPPLSTPLEPLLP